MVTKTVLAPVAGRALSLGEVPDPVFSQGMVGYGAAVNPATEVLDAIAPVSGNVLKLMRHAYVIVTADNVAILVHLGLDTVRLQGAGFVTHVSEGDGVTAGQVIVTYDVPSVVAAGFSPVIPVVVMDERNPESVRPAGAVVSHADVVAGQLLFTVSR